MTDVVFVTFPLVVDFPLVLEYDTAPKSKSRPSHDHEKTIIRGYLSVTFMEC